MSYHILGKHNSQSHPPCQAHYAKRQKVAQCEPEYSHDDHVHWRAMQSKHTTILAVILVLLLIGITRNISQQSV